MINEIEVKEINLTIKTTPILKAINISFEKGKIHGLIGRNGSGKTMLMKCICGFIKPTEGEVYVADKRIGKDCDFPESIGVIIETPGFIPYYSGYKNLKLLADLNRKIDSQKIKQSMKQVGLDPESKLHIKKYSLGMRQRLGLAQAIMENPDLLILDEPMNGLDKDGVELMRSLILDINKKYGTTILITSHIKEDIFLLCRSVYELENGSLHPFSTQI